MSLDILLKALDEFPRKRILVIGDLMLDIYSWGTINRLNPEEEGSPLITVNKDTHVLGGASNVANNIASLRANVTLIGMVNQNDSYGAEFTRQCKNRDIRLITFNDGRPTTTKQRIMSKKRQITRIDREEASKIDEETEHKIIDKLKELNYHCIVLSDYNKGLLTRNLCTEIINISNKKGLKVFVDPKPENYKSFYGAYLLKPNEKGAEGISGLELSKNGAINNEVAKSLCEKIDCEVSVITLGENGVIYYDKESGKQNHIPTYAREVRDVTGAGDSFMATLSLGICSSLNLEDAIRLANIAAGFTVSKVGTYAISSQEIKEYIEDPHFIKLYNEKV